MALCDYYLCDVCRAKALSDTRIDWVPSVGSIRIICKECAETHKIEIIEEHTGRKIRSRKVWDDDTYWEDWEEE